MIGRAVAYGATVAILLHVLVSVSRADTDWTGLRSVEWLVDSSEVIFIGKHGADGVEVLALLKSTPDGLRTHRVGQTVQVLTIDIEKRLGFRAFDYQYSHQPPQIDDRAIYFLRYAPDGMPYMTKRIGLDKQLTIEFSRDHRLVFFGVDKDGQPIRRAIDLIQLVQQRIQHGPVIPYSANRELAEAPHPLRPLQRERFGARWKASAVLSKGDWAFDVCVPDYQPY